jgi:hypothetical protein
MMEVRSFAVALTGLLSHGIKTGQRPVLMLPPLQGCIIYPMKRQKDIIINQFQLNILLSEKEKQGYSYLLEHGIPPKG